MQLDLKFLFSLYLYSTVFDCQRLFTQHHHLTTVEKSMKILICEDEEIMLTALEFRLQRQGFQVDIAENGKQALEKIKTESPDLIVADVMMPFVSGLELINYVRKDLGSTLPIIVISALEHEDTVLEAFRLGATDFITKPFKPNELILRIKKIFQEIELAQ
jgi:two-component system, OmpR family, response regulator VicR